MLGGRGKIGSGIIEAAAKEMIAYFGRDARRINHALKVYGFATTIARLEGLCGDEFHVVCLAALLHDIGIHEAERKYGSTAGNYQEVEGPPIARDILKKVGAPENIIERACFIVGHHHSYGSVDGLDFRIIVEADFIVNIYEGELGEEAVRTIKQKHFETKTGTEILDSMYLE